MTLRIHTIPVTSFRQNSSILWDEKSKDCIISDMGGNSNEINEFIDFIDQNKLNLKAIWLTHGHFDHIQGVSEFLQARNIPVLGPQQQDLFWFQQLPMVLESYGFAPKPAFTPTRWLQEGEELNIGNYSFTVLEIPGHTKGHVVFYSKLAKVLIAGDVLFYQSIGRTDLPGGNYQDLVHNIQTKLLTLPEDTTVITGHGPFTTIGHEKKYNPFLQETKR